jgi:hypothetical protein
MRLRRPPLSDLLFAAVVASFAVAAARLWWTSAIVPGMDYPQYLVFVRAARDYLDPASPFHGTYTTSLWFMPTVLPIYITSALTTLFASSAHPLEVAGKCLLSMGSAGLVAASVYLLHVLGRPRWAVVLVFPLIHSRWDITGGYTPYATAMPILVLGWALAVRWFQRMDRLSGVALALCLCATLWWHGIAFVVAGLGFAVLWGLWDAPSLRARVMSVAPTVPCLVQCAAWLAPTFGHKPAHSSPPTWAGPLEALDSTVEYTWASIPHAQALAMVLAILVCAGLVLGRANVGARPSAGPTWRVENPFLVLSLVYFLAYLAFPTQIGGVEGVSIRFPYPAVLAFVFAWNLPAGRVSRGVVLGSVLAFSVYCHHDLAERFAAFETETRGASDLIDEIGLHDTLYSFPSEAGASKAFAAGHKPLRELQQYATIRRGGLPNSSFAGYGYDYLRYVGDRNPMPGLASPPRWSPEMTRFDYVLERTGQGPNDPHFRLIDRKPGWELYGVCGSHRFPSCT